MPAPVFGHVFADQQFTLLHRLDGVALGGFRGEHVGEQVRLRGECHATDGSAVILDAEHETVRGNRLDAVGVLDVRYGLIWQPSEGRGDHGEIRFETVVHQGIDRGLRRRGHHAEAADDCDAYEQCGGGIRRASLGTGDVARRKPTGDGEDLRRQPSQ